MTLKPIPDFELPWPDKDLSPNARKHWRVVSAAKKAARLTASVLVKNAIAEGPLDFWPHNSAAIKFIFHPPDLRPRDDDNLIASMKAARDGLADGLGIDDRRFRMAYSFGAPRRPSGCVIVQVSDD